MIRGVLRKIAWSRVVRIVPDGLTYLGWRPRHRPPSFVESISRSVRLREIAVSQGLDFPIWRLDDKLAGREFAQEIGLRVPELYAVGSLEECAAEARRRGSAVIKPLQRHSAQGVVVLTLQGSVFYDHIRKKPVTSNGLEGYIRSCQVGEDDVLMLDELIFRPGSKDTPSFDWNFFCFSGEVAFIFQTDRNGETRKGPRPYRCRRADYSTMTIPHFRGYREMRSMADPSQPVALREAAERYSLSAPSAFARIDLYEDDRGPVFGEITPHTSAGFRHTNYFGRELDRQMGRMWEEAEIRLAADSLDRIREHE